MAAAPGNEYDRLPCNLFSKFSIPLYQPRFQVNILDIYNNIYNRWYIANIFQIWSTPVDYEELAVGFEPIRNGEIFGMYDNV